MDTDLPLDRGSFLIDLDGTLVRHGTTEFLPGAEAFLALLDARGYRVIFVTRRGDREFHGHPAYGRAATEAMLIAHGLDHHTIVYDVMSPRILVDDSGIGVLERQTNVGFSDGDLARIAEHLAP